MKGEKWVYILKKCEGWRDERGYILKKYEERWKGIRFEKRWDYTKKCKDMYLLEEVRIVHGEGMEMMSPQSKQLKLKRFRHVTHFIRD